MTMALQYAHIDKWGNLFVGIVAFGSIIAHTAVLLVFQLGQPRIFFSMSRDGLLPKAFSNVHQKYRTPAFSTILTGIAVGVTAMFTSIDEMVDPNKYRYFICFYPGLFGDNYPEEKRPGPSKIVQNPVGACYSNTWSTFLFLFNARSPGCNMGTIWFVAFAWPGVLFYVRV